MKLLLSTALLGLSISSPSAVAQDYLPDKAGVRV